MGAFHFVFDRVANILYEEIEKEQEVWRACKTICYSIGLEVITFHLLSFILYQSKKTLGGWHNTARGLISRDFAVITTSDLSSS